MEEYSKYYLNQMMTHPKDREREFFDHLHQLSIKPSEEVLINFYHFLKRYLKVISPLIVSSYVIDFLITFLVDYQRYVLKIFMLFSSQRSACSRMLYLRLPTLLLQTPSTKSLNLLNKLLSSSSSFEIFTNPSLSKTKFVNDLMILCPSYLYPQPMSSDKILQSSYHAWRYIALTGNASLIPAIDTFPTDTAFVNEQVLIKQLYEVTQTGKTEPIDNVIHVLYSPDGIILLRDRQLIQTIRFIFDKYPTHEIITQKCVEALELAAVDYHCLISMFNENFLTKFEHYLQLFSNNEIIISKILNILCYMCSTDALVSFVNQSGLLSTLFPQDQEKKLQFPSSLLIKRKLVLIAFQCLQSKVIKPECIIPIIDLTDTELYDLTIPLSSLLTINNCNILLEKTKEIIKDILIQGSESTVLIESSLYFLVKTQIDSSFIPKEKLVQYQNSMDFNIHSLSNQIINSKYNNNNVLSLLSIPIEIDSSNIFQFLTLYSCLSNILISGISPSHLDEVFSSIIKHFPMIIFSSTKISLSEKYIAASDLITFILNIQKNYSISEQLTELCFSTLLSLIKSNSNFRELWFEHSGYIYLLKQLPRYSTLKLLHKILKSKEICFKLLSQSNDNDQLLEDRFLEYLNDDTIDIASLVKCIENIMDNIPHSKLNTLASSIVKRTEELIDSGNNDISIYLSIFQFIKKAIDCSSLVCDRDFINKIIQMLFSCKSAKLKKILIDVCASIYNTNPTHIRHLLDKKKLLELITEEDDDDQELYCAATRCLAIMSKSERIVKSKIEITSEVNKVIIQENNRQGSFTDLINPTILMVPVGSINDFVFVKTVENIQGYEREFKKKFDLPDMLPSYKFIKTTWDLFVNDINKVIYAQMIYGVIDCSTLSDKDVINSITMFHECVTLNWEESIGHLALLLNLPQSSELFKIKLNNEIKSLLFVVDTLNPTSINSILVHTESTINTWCDNNKPLHPHFNPIFSKKIPPLSYLSCAQANLYKKNWDNAYQMFLDSIKAYKVQQLFNGKFFTKSVIGFVASIMLDPIKRNLQQYTKEYEDAIKDAIKFIDNLDSGHYYCKELLFYQAQYYLKQKVYQKAQQIIEEIDSKHHEKISKTEDIISALMFDSLLKQLKMNHHRQYILYSITAYKSQIKSFDIYCVDELAELLGVNDLEKLDLEYEEQTQRPHLIMEKKVQWSTLRAYVIMKKVMLRDIYDETMAKLLLRLLAYFHEHVSETDQIESINRLDLICKAIGSPVYISSNLPSIPVIESISLSTVNDNEKIRSRKVEKSIFIYDPSMPKKVPIVWSSNETSFITIKMSNPLYPMLNVDNITPWCEGVEIETHFKCVDIMSTSSITFEYAITPKTSGLLKIYGLEFDCCSLHFKSVPIGFRCKKELTPCCVVPVVHSVPRLKSAPGTFLSKAISLFPGQTNESKLELINDGDLAVNWINFKVKDDDSTHLTEITVSKPLQDILPILPNQRVEVPLAISARGELSNINIEISYASSSTARFGRTFSIPINVIVSVGLLIDKWEIIPIEEMLLVSCVVYNPSAFSFTVKMMPNPQWNVDDFFVQERRETFSESQSRRRLLVAVKKPSYTLTPKNAAKWINEVISIRWISSSGCDGTISIAESETVAVNTSN
ncbi:hypothetical protein ENUP19_0009G0064 [Entamoeba nuttalli]|uniref:Uncharacterized protein n=2 Tax=Entamoeba nuttalli TaxID=412467 RepID=K2GTI3_ENTNP|nr:hypothetical protein ENU1_208090 [Entamoeba nuttalli P19]EKE37127.1 hypothetical protein ENU1_208090 [Entamoeba nuttalli P19]|eukprot:XP_008860535.1 hypothetical protein ENU1_208090 [Entamoeba nuttalli P19]